MNKVESNMNKLIPLVTEKALKLSEVSRVVFKAPKDMTKGLSTKILNIIYKGNKVIDIKSVLVKGKTKKFKKIPGKRKDYKKLYVKFEKSIDITTEVK
ncbi:MAG: 50S ribosomal protein L23 [Rickettsiales bacterium]|jgi:large subunit ribosomal protein L23|nr:50S ribosomal protein L23 [Rickettsiales bacterium]